MANCNCIYEEFCSMLNGEDIKLPTPCEYRKDRSRFVELPCKVGDTVWFTTYGDRPTCTEVYKAFCNIGTDGLHSYFETQDTNGNIDYFHGEAFGKTVFLSREEAKKALTERGAGNG